MTTTARLRAFVALAETGSVKAAAQLLVVTESAVSAAVAALTREIGVPLVERVGRGVCLTPSGQTYAGYARTILGLHEEALTAARGDIGGEDGDAERGDEAVVDLMETTAERRAELAARLPQHAVLAAHIGKDTQRAGTDPAALLGPWSSGRRLAVAGGLTADDLPGFAGAGDIRVIVGSAVTAAADPAEAAGRLARAAGRS
ncbi:MULTISPECIES: LysR family transcriptional regulator [Streptomyces]|uniref:HTH lysR-type domain-containing protein n=1 Tax=Streptomyces dengpaensis TaxID=2049881 RepID=A0ABM6SJM4_9ACTN|nr:MULTISPECIES: LysR family transcriptional regulator [Streptomyces]AVH54881.1 hypothetical protein C4B68_02675 [Streptomyces dengpaensis]